MFVRKNSGLMHLRVGLSGKKQNSGKVNQSIRWLKRAADNRYRVDSGASILTMSARFWIQRRIDGPQIRQVRRGSQRLRPGERPQHRECEPPCAP